MEVAAGERVRSLRPREGLISASALVKSGIKQFVRLRVSEHGSCLLYFKSIQCHLNLQACDYKLKRSNEAHGLETSIFLELLSHYIGQTVL